MPVNESVFTLNIIANNSLITPKVGMSGGDRIFLELVKNLSKRKVLVNLFTGLNVLDFIQENRFGSPQYYLFSQKRFSVYKNIFVNSLFKIFLGIIAAWNYKQADKKPLIIYSASDFWPDVIPAFIMKLKNSQSIWIGSFYQLAPSPWQKDSPYKGKAWLKGVIYWLIQKPMYWLIRSFAEIVFVTSIPDVSLFPDHQRSGGYFVVKGGVDISPSEKYLVKKIEQKKHYEACFIGRLHPQKGVLELMDIWKLVVNKKPDAKLAIIGNGPLKEKIERKIQELNLKSNVDLLGFLDGEEKYQVFKTSKMVLHPATYDSGGMAAAEAMAWGLPGVSFDLESLKTYYPTGMVKIEKGNLKKFADTVIKFLENDKLREKIGNDALKLIRSHWSWDKRVDDIYKLLKLKSL